MKKEIKDVAKYHQDKIKKQANKNPLEAYFLGGFDLADDEKQKETEKYLKTLINK
tara:strand:+ start:844 stop:1008 length:165 start_codon:yes stop_codon:yes gene_type:complete